MLKTRKTFAENLTRRIVVYGAGNRAPYALSYCRARYQPEELVLSDSDPAKWGRVCYGMPVVSPEKIKMQWGGMFSVYISPAAPVNGAIKEQLISDGFVGSTQILNQFPTQRRYLSCSSLEQVAIATNEGIYFCCMLRGLRNESPFVPWQDTVEKTVDAFLAKRDAFINGLQHPTAESAHPCAGCRELHDSEWSTERRVGVLALSLSYPCQLSCCYCDLSSNAKNLPNHKQSIQRAFRIDIQRVVTYLKELGQLQPIEPIQISGGEISILPQRKELLNAVSEYPLQIFTNAIRYDAQIHRLICREGSFLNVSLDSGTRETYYRVKGLDAFPVVCENLRRYAQGGGHIHLKYILLPENHAREDLDGFISLAKEISVECVMISRNINVPVAEMDPRDLEDAHYLADACTEHQLPYTILDYFC